ncbi:FadR/GntR family transcriptional regulator [Nocardioides sp. NPDC047086]|uniref:FadR/GntR family transcriptional regulator n=1 Tax=Nocardioides sp. NPDC047086 TaxID=3154810 RepID=UPI003405FC5E
MSADMDVPEGNGSIVFQPVANVRISATIVDQIRARIRAGELPVGSRLPSERALCDQFQVSRRTVREAFRMLEATGHIVIKLGKEGGAFVSAPSVSLVGEGLTDLISTAALSSAEVTEVRTIMELGFLPLIVDRATEDDIARLRAMCDEHEAAREDGTYTVAMSLEFHRALASCAHNSATTLLLDAMRDSILTSLVEAHHRGTSGVAEHRRVVDAIAARDLDTAVAELSRHLDRTVQATTDN